MKKVTDNVYAVGIVDWNVRRFHGNTYITKKGATYNSYLVIDKEPVLIDVVNKGFEEEFIANISEIIDPKEIKHVILNHLEPDHSGAIEYIIKKCPNAKFYATAKLKEGALKYYKLDTEINIVKTGDSIKTGDNTLTFIEVPMIHWPDSMMTYCPEKKLLFSNDAFGQHITSDKIFADEIDRSELLKETKKYYANILWALGPIIQRKLTEILAMNPAIDIIAPSHGMIWRKEPAKIIEQYFEWAQNKTVNKAVIVYETMWGSTEIMARAILNGLSSKNIDVKLFDIASTDFGELAYELLDAKAFVIGSSTHDNEMLPYIAGFLYFLKGLKPKNRIAVTFGSYGWAGGAVKEMNESLKSCGVDVIGQIDAKFKPDSAELKKCFDAGVQLAEKLN
ncbi:MAG: FprA family A-type flavoprotein [Endomicrobiaceae bacterium]|nr:FprA family A-type flavoprotein [Endomicrobiaceae bacterium]